MKTVSDIIDYLGEAEIAAQMSVTVYAVRKARRLRSIPALWYDQMENMAGRPLPRECFTFKRRPNE